MKWLASLGATPGDGTDAAPDCARTVTRNTAAAPATISSDFAARMIDDMPPILAGMSGSARFRRLLLRVGDCRGFLLDATRHMAADLAVLPRARVRVAVEEQPDGECADARNLRVGHHDHRRVADEAHRNHDRDLAFHAAALHAGIEAPKVD